MWIVNYTGRHGSGVFGPFAKSHHAEQVVRELSRHPDTVGAKVTRYEQDRYGVEW